MGVKTAKVFLALFASTAGLATEQNTTKTTHKKTRMLTAAFKKSEDAREHKFSTAKGGAWEINGYTLKLGDRARHAVAITGMVPNAAILGKKEDAKAEAREHDMGEYSMEHGHLMVADLRMVEISVRSNTNYTF